MRRSLEQNPMSKGTSALILKRLRAMGVYKPSISSSNNGDSILIESYPLEARILASVDPNEGPIHTYRIVNVHGGDTITSGVVTIGQDLVQRVGQVLVDFHEPAFREAKEKEADVMRRLREQNPHSAQDWEQAISTGDWFDSGVVAGQSSRWDSAEQAWQSRKSHRGAPPEYVMEARQQFIRGFDVGRGKVYRNPEGDMVAGYYHPAPLAKRKRFLSHYEDFRKAGYNAQQAKDIAEAERWALDNDVLFEWEQDDTTNRDFTDEGEEYFRWRVVARHPDGETASLAGVDFGEGKGPWSNSETDIYKRATEADLSMELMAALGHTGKRNPASSSSLQRRLEDEAFEGGKVWGESGSWASGVSNANVRRYGFVKWWNNTLTPATERQVRKSAVERAFNEGYKIGRERANLGFRERAKGKRNPESSAADLYESFHGKPSEEVLEYGEEIHYHENLAGLGVLTEIKVDCFSGYSAVLKFDRETQLCSNEEGTQLYIIGGDQSLNLGSLKFKDDEVDKDQVAIGVITEITYNTQKGFHNFKPTDYYHELGEESGYQPILTYDTRNQQLTIAGGAYRIKPEGIVN